MIRLRITAILLTIFSISFFPKICFSQPDLTQQIKSVIYRVVISLDDSSRIYKEATGIVFKYRGELFLITNKHVIQDSSENVFDSIFVCHNEKMPNGEILSNTVFEKVNLRKNGEIFYFMPSCPETDLTLISISKSNSDSKWLYNLNTSVIRPLSEIRQRLGSETVLTIIGFPNKKQMLRKRAPEILWGDFTGFESDYIKTNAPVLPGNSGSAVIARHENKYYLVGIMAKKKGRIGYAIPSNYIFTCFKRYFDKVDEIKNE